MKLARDSSKILLRNLKRAMEDVYYKIFNSLFIHNLTVKKKKVVKGFFTTNIHKYSNEILCIYSLQLQTLNEHIYEVCIESKSNKCYSIQF